MLSPDFHNSIPSQPYSTRTAIFLSMFNHYVNLLFRMPLSIDSTAKHERNALEHGPPKLL